MDEEEKAILEDIKDYLNKGLAKPKNTKEEIIECFLWHRKLTRFIIRSIRLLTLLVGGVIMLSLITIILILFGSVL